MTTINLRIDEATRRLLEEQAATNGLSISEYVRNLINEAVVPLRSEVDPDKSGDEPSPEHFEFFERKVLSMLHRIMARVMSDDDRQHDAASGDGEPSDQYRLAEVLERGFTAEYWYEAAAFSRELSPRNCRRVNDILEMFRVAGVSIQRLEEDGTPVDRRLREVLTFRGFDHNRPLELQMSMYLTHMVEDGRWEEVGDLLEQTRGNSHSPMLETYDRMVSEYRAIKKNKDRVPTSSHLLSTDELQRIAHAWVHPSNRGRA